MGFEVPNRIVDDSDSDPKATDRQNLVQFDFNDDFRVDDCDFDIKSIYF